MSLARAAPLPVTVATDPHGATIYIDGKEHKAKGKGKLKLKLDKGSHKIRVELPGYRTLEKDIEVSKKQEHFELKLDAAKAQILLRPSADDEARGAQIFIDGAAAGTVPADVDAKPGQHTVEVRKPGFKTYTETVNISGTDSKTVTVALAADAKRGTLVVASPRGQIYVDGQNRGLSPALVENLDEGEHTVEVRESEGAAPIWQQRVQVTAGRQTRVTAAVAAAGGSAKSEGDSSAELAQLRQDYSDLRQSLEDMQRQIGGGATIKPKREANIPIGFRGNAMPGSALPGTVEKDPDFLHALSVNVSATLRYEWLRSADQTDVLQDGNVLWDALRARVRLGATYDQGPIVAGIRLTTGQTTNPTAPFTTLGEAFRAHSIGIDHFYGTVRPLADHDRLSLSFGAMPQPFWRGDRGTVRDEMIWDDDISPEGVAVHVTFFKTKEPKPRIKLDNNLGYFQLYNIQPFRFIGLTGSAYIVGEQLHFAFQPYFNIALAYYDMGNLNVGLRVPSFTPTSAFPATPNFEGESADLLRPGLQRTNNFRSYGINANGFVTDHYRVGNVLVQLDLPLRQLKKLGEPELFLMGNYTRNFGVDQDANGWGITFGIRAGSWESGAFHPLNLWFTWRDVDNDATLATIADSDLCQGTGCRGLEFGANYRIFRHLLGQLSYFDFEGFPLKDFRIQRVLVDVVADF